MKTDMGSVSREFIDFMKAQENLRQFIRHNPKIPVPEYLRNEFRKTQKLYEASKVPQVHG